MNIKGKLFKKYPEKQWQGKNGTVVSREFAIETVENTYKNYYIFTAQGDLLDKLDNFRLGDSIDVNYVVNGRLGTGAYDGRVFMNFKALDIILYMEPSYQPETPTGHSQFEEPQDLELESYDQLPF